MMEEAEKKMFVDSRARLEKKHPDYKVIGFDLVLPVNEAAWEVKNIVERMPETTHLMLVRFAKRSEGKVRLAVFQYRIKEKNAEFKALHEPELGPDLAKKIDERFTAATRADGELLKKAIAECRRSAQKNEK